MNKKLKIIFSSLFLFILLISAIPANSQAMSKYDKGHTGVHGKTWMKDSNFVFELSALYWYKNLDLYLETWENESDYRIILNNEEIDSGTISEGKTHVNYTLPTGQPVDLVIEIDEYKYEFRHKLITRRSSDNWKPPDEEKEGTIFSDTELIMEKLRVFGQTLVFTLAALFPATYLAKKRKENKGAERLIK